MGGSSFELIMREVLSQKQRMDDLLAENRELLRQLAELREGRGILLEIQGKWFALAGTPSDDYLAQVASTAQESPDIYQPTVALVISGTTTVAMGNVPETPLPTGTDQLETLPYYLDTMEEQEEEEQTRTSSSFLEELLVDEFASAETSPIAVWKGADANTSPITRKLHIDEEQKAVLRKELIGSFLLE